MRIMKVSVHLSTILTFTLVRDVSFVMIFFCMSPLKEKQRDVKICRTENCVSHNYRNITAKRKLKSCSALAFEVPGLQKSDGIEHSVSAFFLFAPAGLGAKSFRSLPFPCPSDAPVLVMATGIPLLQFWTFSKVFFSDLIYS